MLSQHQVKDRVITKQALEHVRLHIELSILLEGTFRSIFQSRTLVVHSKEADYLYQNRVIRIEE